MDNRRLLIGLGVILVIFLAFGALSQPRDALGQSTIPTRTPKPAQPPPDDGGGEVGGGNDQTQPPAPGEQPTAETQTAVTPVPTFAAIAAPLAQAAPCALQPTFTAAGEIAVYASPGAGATKIASLSAGDIRLVSGRAPNIPWWRIVLVPSGLAGWVSDASGIVSGSTTAVPMAGAQEAASWAPTPDPRCLPVQTASAQPVTVQVVTLPNPFFPFFAFVLPGSGAPQRGLPLAEYRYNPLPSAQN